MRQATSRYVYIYIYIYIYICKKTPIVNTHLQEKDGKQNKGNKDPIKEEKSKKYFQLSYLHN